MTTFEGTLFVAFGIMAVTWLISVVRISRMLKQRHIETYDELKLEDMWPKTIPEWFSRRHSNLVPVSRLLVFLFSKRYRNLQDDEISRLGDFMRLLLTIAIPVFIVMFYSLTTTTVDEYRHRQQTQVTPTSQDSKRTTAFKLHRNEQWQQAITLYDELIDESGEDAELMFWRGMANWKMKNNEKALDDFRRVTRPQPKNFEAFQYADRILSSQKRWSEVLEIWDRFIANSPDHAEAWFERGGTYYHQGNLIEAQANAQKACELGKAEACGWASKLEK